jgi:hypothetical protein
LEVFELRNYLMQEERTADFIRYFEEHFLLSQRDEGMHVLGQFALADDPRRFVWIRGFADMASRLRGLQGFYGGAFWLARRDEANAMMLEHHDVHLLRPLAPVAAITGGRALEDAAAEPAGVLPPERGLIAVDFYRTEPASLKRLVEAYEGRLAPALAERGAQVLGHFVAELAPNDFPRLPVIQDPGLLVVVSAYRDRPHHDAARRAELPPNLRDLLRAAPSSLCLRPTARSLIRYAD